MLKIGLVEDEVETRTNLLEYLSQQTAMECVVAGESVEHLLTILPAKPQPAILLMDIGLPGMSGIQGVSIIKGKYPDIEVIMLTNYADSHRIFEALCAGASGYVLKSAPFAEIKSAIETLAMGGSPMSPQIARKVIQFFQTPKKTVDSAPESSLSSKEKEVVIGLVDGLSYKMIGDRMHVSVETIRTHIKNIYKKLHVHSKAEVISKSLRGEI